MYTDVNVSARPLKVVLPVHHFLPTYSAGAELYTARLAQRLRRRGYDVEIVAVESTTRGVDDELIVETDAFDGVPVHRLSFNLDSVSERERRLFENPIIGQWFERYLQATTPDLVHFHAGYLLGVAPFFAAFANRIPTVLTLHDYWFVCPRYTLLRGDGSLCPAIPDDPAGCAWCNLLMKRRYQVLEKLTAGKVGEVATRFDLLDKRDLMAYRRVRLAEALARVDAIISPSNFLADMMTDVVDRTRIEVIRFGFDVARPPHAVTLTPTDEFRFGFIGQVSEHKGVHLLVEAFRRINSSQPIVLDIYGNIPNPAYRQRLEQLASGDTRIHFHGRYDNVRVAEILAAFTVCVAPSTWYENSPVAIQEAQVAQVPVITAAFGGMQELVADDIDGLHFEPRSAASLTTQLQRLLDEPTLLTRLQQGARARRVRSFDDELDDIERIYDRVLSPRSLQRVSMRVIT